MFKSSKRLVVLLSALASTLASGGCASCFDMFSPNTSAGCKVAIVPLFAAAAVTAPFVLAAGNIRDDLRDRAWRKDTWTRLQANDPKTVADCIISCDLPKNIESDPEKMEEIHAHNVDLAIAWWANPPSPGHRLPLMMAWLYKGAGLVNSDPSMAKTYLRKAAELAANPDTAAEIRTSSGNEQTYTHAAGAIQMNLMILRYQNISVHPSSADDFQCQSIAAWPPAWLKGSKWWEKEADDELRMRCRMAFNELYQKKREDDSFTLTSGVFDPISCH